MKKILIILLFCGFWANAQQYHDKGAKFEFATNEGDTITVNTRIPIIDEFGLINYYVDVADLLALNPAPVLEWGNITGTLSNQTDLQGALDDKADQSALTAHTTNGNIHFTQSAISITESQISDLKDYLRGDINDTNGANKLTLGSLEVAGQTTLQNGLNLTSIPVGTSDNILTINGTGDVEQRVFSLGDIDIANESGVSQFPVGLGDQLRIQGSGDTSISFDGITNTININSTPGSGGGGAVTSFNGRDGAVVSQAGDYSTAMVNENTNLYFTEGRVRGTDLTGLTIANTPISSTNTFLQALGRLQGQINNRDLSFSAGNLSIEGGNTVDLDSRYYSIAQLNTSGFSNVHWNNITNRPTNLSGYGITNAYTKGETLQYFLRKDVSDSMNGTLTAVGFNGDGSGLTGVIKHNSSGVNTTTGGSLNTNDGQIYYHSNSSNNYGGTLPAEYGLLYQFQGSTVNRHFGIFHNNNSTDFYLGSWDTNNNPTWNEIWHDGNQRSDSQNDSRYVQQTRTISTGTGLTGGGNLSSNRTINFDTSWGDSRYAVMNDINANYGQLTIKTLNDNNRGLRLINGNTAQSSFLYMDNSNDLNINNSSASSRPVHINKGGNGSLIVGGGVNAGFGVLQNNADEILNLPSVAGGVMFNMQNSSGSDFATGYGSAFGIRGSNNERTFFLYKPNGASQDFYISDYGNNSSWRHSLLYHSGNLSPVETSRQINTGLHLSGGGNLSANRTLTLTPTVNQWIVDSQGNQRMYFCSNNNGGILLRSSAAGGELQWRDNSNNTVFRVDDNGNVTAQGDVIANSDRRLKKNIKRIDNALAIVQLLGGYEYDRIDIDKHQAGVIAQEVEEVFPVAVSEDEKGIKSVAYNQLIALLIEAIKEQQIEIENLKNMINEK